MAVSRRYRPSTEQLVGWAVPAAVTLFVVWQVFPELILRDTTPVYGDLGGHVHEPAFLRDHLLPHWRLSGWSQDWFTGYPSLTFYFPLGSLLIVLLDFLLLPYNVALKLVSASGAIALPLCAYAFGRLDRRDRFTSACYAVAVLPLLLHPDLFAAGGSIGSTTTGEYSYEMALALGLVVLGLARAGLRTGRHRALTAGLLAATALLHLVLTVTVVAGIVVATALRPSWARLRWSAPVLAAAGALTGFWSVPFLLRTAYTAGPDYPRATPWTTWLLPSTMRPLVVVALVGGVALLVRDRIRREDDDNVTVFLLLMVVVAGVLFALTPDGRVWNGRYLGVWFLWLGLLAGHGLARLARYLDALRGRAAAGGDVLRPHLARTAGPVVLFVVVLVLWDSRAAVGLFHRNDTTTAAFVTRLPARPYEGYEGSENRAEYQELLDTVRSVVDEHGCGRAHFQWDDWHQSRVPLLWLIPYFTDGCMPVATGVYPQSSATSPYLFAANARLSPDAMSVFGRRPFDAAAGIADLRLLGIRYLLAASLPTQQAVEALPDVRLLAETEWYGGRFWRVYEITGVEVVEPLRYTPVVVRRAGRTRHNWEGVAGRWFDGGEAREVVAAAAGPRSWPRRDRVSGELPRLPTATTEVTDVRIGQDRVSFRVSRPGVPVLVKVSYFPNWQASGAEGPWRVTPNQMVVVPTSNVVTLRYGRTTVDHAGVVISLVGLAGLVVLARGGLRCRRQPA